jgi:hypothetical protein
MAARITAYLVASIVVATFIAGLIVGAQREDDVPADLIVMNARVYAGDGTSDLAEAVAIRGNKIARVGTLRDMQRLRRAQTRTIDAHGGAVVPGFNDAHTHLVRGGLGLDQLDLGGADTLDALKDAVRAWAAAYPDREWLLGRGWNYTLFPTGLPTRQLLDSLVPDRPAYLVAYDGHTAWANSRALALAGISRRTKSPAGGTIVQDPRTGQPTGVLKETAMTLVADVAPEPTREDRLAALRAAFDEAHRRGVTSATNAGGTADDLDLFAELRRDGELTLRVYQALSAPAMLSDDDLAALRSLRARFADDPLLKTGAIKVAADGVVETFTAALLEPYTRATPAAMNGGTAGEPRLAADELNRLVAVLDREGWQIMTHAVGDRAVRMTLDAYQAAARVNPAPDRGRRHRIEHIEVIDPADAPRFGALGVIASMQPAHALPEDPPGVWSANLGETRVARGWLWGSITRAGGRLAFGSDWPVAELDPRVGLHAATTRTTLEGLPGGGSHPAERLPLDKAIDAYTRGSAWASFDELRKGTLERDMLADLVIFDRDIFALPPDRLTDARVVMTIFDGKIVYRRDAPATTTE